MPPSWKRPTASASLPAAWPRRSLFARANGGSTRSGISNSRGTLTSTHECDCLLCSARPLLQILRRNRIVRALGAPIDGHHPPPSAVVEQLNAVDAPRERLLVRGGTSRLIRAECVHETAERF